MIEWYLEAENGDADLIQIVELKEFRSFTVGRKRDFDIISLNPLVSRTHGLFKHKVNNKIYVHDSNSSNGIWVNDEKITPGQDHLLNENDLIGIGAPSSAQEARLELFRLRGTHLITDSDNIPKLNPKKENTPNETIPPTVSNANVSPSNDKLASNSPKVSNNEEDGANNDIKQSNGPKKIENVTSHDPNSTSSSRNAMPIVVDDVKIESNLKADKKHCVEMSHETPTHSENNGEHVFSFPEDESEHIIPKYAHSSKNSHPTDSASKTYDIINVDEDQHKEKIVKDNSVNNKTVENVVPCKELIPVVRLDRLELASSCRKNQNVKVADKPKKKFEVISPSSSDDENENVDKNTKHKQNVNTKYSNKSSSEESPDISFKQCFDKLSHKKTSKVSKSWDKHRDISDKESYEPRVHNKHGKLISKSRPKKSESSSSEKDKRKERLFEKLFGKSDSREKEVEKSGSKKRKTSSDSSSSTEKQVSCLTSKPRVKRAEKSVCKERKLSSASSCSIDIPISFLTSASRVKSSEKFASKTSFNNSSSEDEAISSKRSNSREKQKGKSARSRIRSDSSDYSDKSAPTERKNVRQNEIKTKKSTTHSTDKPVSFERSDSKDKQLKTEMIDHISLDSKNSNTSQESEVSVNVKLSVAENLFAEVSKIKQIKSESILQTVPDIQEASTSKTVPSVEEVRTIKQEIFDERQILAERQLSPIMYASHVSISSESDTSPPVPKPKVLSEVNNSSFSISCDIGEIICLSDDDDIFPKSQMFDDDIIVKDEPLSRDEREEGIAIKSEQHSEHEEYADEYPIPENDDNVFGIIKKDVEFDDDAILVDDDENDEVDSLWYSRLSQPGFSSSQLEEPQEQFDDKNIISIRTGPKVLNFLDDKDLITNELNEALDNELQQGVDFDKESLFSPRTVQLHQDAEEAANIRDDSVPICVVIHSIEPRSSRSAIVREPTVDELDTTSKLDDIKTKISTKKSYAKPPVIDAPHLIKGRRKTTEEIKPKGLNKRGRKRKQSVDERATTAVVPVPVRTFGTGTNLDKSVVNELHKRHKRRRPSTDILPKDKKQEIREERMKKLKEIAQKTAEDKKQDEKPKNTSKPYIKLSSSRGLFLTDKGPVQETEKRKISVKPLSELEPKPKKKFVIPRKKNEENNKVVEEVNTLAVPSTSKDNNVNIDNNKKNIMHQIPNTVIEEENQNAITEKSTKKRVTFNDKPQIRVYIIDEGNHMNKCTSKDAPLPRKIIQTVPPTRIADDLPENIVLCDILSWVPIWLEEQKNINAAPKLSMHKPIQMLHTFNTHGDYCNIVVPLLLLELWRSVFRDWINSRKPVMLACIDDVQPMHICRMNMLSIHCHAVITKLDSDRYLHPVRGDLLVIEILLGDTSRQCAVIKKLGYVVDITKRRLNANDLIDTKLIHTTVIPEFLVQYKIMLKDFNTEINRDRLIRIRAISRVGTSLRIFKSVSLLNKSPLCKFILNPQVNDYKVPKLTHTKLVISDKLDVDQVKCMVEAVQMCVRPEPGIYMIQGPPGTGKSRLIKNIVHQLIYGERKAGTKPNCILLCAPSNGAIDELARKLLEMRQSLPQEKRFRMVRLGPPNSIHPKVKPVSLPHLVDAFVQKQLNFKREANDAVMDDLNFRQSKINMLKNKLVSLQERKLNTTDVEIQLQKAKNDLELFHNRSKREISYHERKALERTSEETVITKADIVCSTLSSCVASRMEEMYHRNLLHFTCCIIDEATQSGEQETLIPLILGIKKLILVGDPAQLPATVLSQEAKQLGYGNSLFYRIQKCFEHLPENPIRMLKTQYRMHPDICKFPNEHFYYGKLINSSALIDNRNANIRCTFSLRYRVFALRAPQHHSAAHAYLNVPEAEFVLVLTKLVLARTDYSVGIITPYTKQREYLQRGLEEITKETDKAIDRVTVNTVDGFQGQERDVIIMSCVRHNSNMFLADQQRLNVSLTRAKHALFICANTELFKNDDIWTKLEQDATKRRCLKYLTKTDYENEKYVTSLLYKS